MKTRLSSSIGERINKFDSLDNPTVTEFNNLFIECPLKDYSPKAMVSIGQLLSGDRRELQVGTETVQHKMFSDVLYGMDREEYYNEHEKELDEIMGHPV